MAYVIGRFEISFDEGEEGKREMKINVKDDLRLVKGPRPKGYAEIPGCDPDVLRGIKPGVTTARLGVGCALMIEDITRLHWGNNSRVLNNLRQKVPRLFDGDGNLSCRRGVVGLWRDGNASGTCWCADVCAGVAENTSVWIEAVREAVEMGFYTEDNRPARLSFKDGGQDCVVQKETRLEWEKTIGSSLHNYQWPKIPCEIAGINYSTEPASGSVEIVYQLDVHLPAVEGGWRMCDTEHMQVKKEYVPLNRQPVLIAIPSPALTDTEEACPVLISFGPEGVDPRGVVAKVYSPSTDSSFTTDLVNEKMWKAIDRAMEETAIDYIRGR